MLKTALTTLAISVFLIGVTPLDAQCHMQYNVSVYTDGYASSDFSTVYGYSNFVDNSVTCGTVHSNYQSIVTIYAPGGSYVSSENSGLQSSTYMYTNSIPGTYDVVGEASLWCPIAASQIESGGPNTDVPVTPTVELTGGSSSSAGYMAYGSDQPVLLFNQVSAAGLPQGGQYNWTVNNSSRLTLNATSSPDTIQPQVYSPSTSPGDTVITVNYTLNGVPATPASMTTTATVYRYLSQNGSYNPMALNPYGYGGNVYYAIYAQPGNNLVRIGNLSLYEVVNVTSVTPSSFASTVTLIQSSGSTDVNGQVIDYLAVGSNSPLPSNLQIIDSQDIAVEGLYVRGNTLTYSSSTVTIQNNGPYN